VCVCVCVLSRPPAGLVAWLVSWPVVAALLLACWRGFNYKRNFTVQVGFGLLAFFRLPVCADVLYRIPHLIHLVLLQWCERPRQKDKAGLRAKLLEDMQVGASSFWFFVLTGRESAKKCLAMLAEELLAMRCAGLSLYLLRVRLLPALLNATQRLSRRTCMRVGDGLPRCQNSTHSSPPHSARMPVTQEAHYAPAPMGTPLRLLCVSSPPSCLCVCMCVCVCRSCKQGCTLPWSQHLTRARSLQPPSAT
jgi:hypothetical protein